MISSIWPPRLVEKQALACQTVGGPVPTQYVSALELCLSKGKSRRSPVAMSSGPGSPQPHPQYQALNDRRLQRAVTQLERPQQGH